MAKIYGKLVQLTALLAITSITYADDDAFSATNNSGNFWQKFDVDGRINLDADHFEGIYRADNLNITQKETETRRARLSLKFSPTDNWSSKVQIAIHEGNDDYELKDAYIRYKGFDFADIKIGQSKEPFGLETTTSSGNTTFIERSLASSFSLGRSKGLNFSKSKRNYSWSLGAYQVEEDGNIKSEGDNAYTARITFSPVNRDNSYQHYGIAYSQRDLLGAEYELKSNGGVNTAFNFLDTRNIETDSLEQAGIEVAWGRGALSFQSEYQQLNINAVDSEKNASYNAYYGQLSYFLTQDHRPYKKGRFANLKPSSSKGAWELAIRHGVLQSIEIGNANKNTDIEIASTTLGLNYYLNKRFKIMLNAIETDTTGIIEDGIQTEGSAVSMRIQLKI